MEFLFGGSPLIHFGVLLNWDRGFTIPIGVLIILVNR
jgi:hypothetical protein